MKKTNKYSEELRRIRSLLIVTSLQKKADLNAKKLLENFDEQIKWFPLDNYLIDKEIWEYATRRKKYDPKYVFCHPDILFSIPSATLYYRGLCGLSQKAAKNYFGSIEKLEKGSARAKLDFKKATRMACTFNAFICSIIKNSTDWTLDNGYRTIIATIGITIDGSMRNRIGEIAEERIKSLFMEFISNEKLAVSTPAGTEYDEKKARMMDLKDDVQMVFGSEPDISFFQHQDLVAVIEIKGGTDPAGALERYGAATKSFQHSIESSKRCKNFYLAAVFTPELKRRIKDDRLVENYYDIIKLLENPDYRSNFFREIFHHTLRLI
jgi:hypothetical protein